MIRRYAFFFLNDTATPEIYPLSLHDALPIWTACRNRKSPWSRYASARNPPCPLSSSIVWASASRRSPSATWPTCPIASARSEEHTSELQSQSNLVCRLLLEQKTHNLSSDSYT